MKPTTEQIAQAFALYLGQEVRLPDYDEPQCISSVNVDGYIFYDDEDAYCSVEVAKLLLTPLSQISDEDAVEVAKLAGYNNSSWSVERKQGMGRALVLDICEGISSHYETTRFEAVLIFHFLISKGYAVPLPWAWAEGKTAIELDLAREKK